ncbi:MAG: shikimate kinase [Oscillospiraceae bacterium]|nr:shikimate kinase [Oscillospiraceae bacterium]
MNLDEIRKEIDEADEKILKLFLRRMELAKEAAREKNSSGKPLSDESREAEILKRAAKNSEDMSSYSIRLFKELIVLSKEYQSETPEDERHRKMCIETGNIVIIGMPGSGKSTVAECISAKTGRKFVNIDTEIEKAAGKSIPEIFAEDGEQAFRYIEREETAKAGALTGAVIATGGGVVKDFRNYAPLHANGRIYYIRREITELEIEGRPLSKSLENLKVLEKEREPLYCRFADAEIQNDVTLEEAARRILLDYCVSFGGETGDVKM